MTDESFLWLPAVQVVVLVLGSAPAPTAAPPGLLSVRARPGLRDLGVRAPAHDRITIDFARVDEADLTGLRSGQDVGFRGELVRGDPRIELDADLDPQAIEGLTRDGAEHGRESLRLVQVIRNEDGLDARVVRED